MTDVHWNAVCIECAPAEFEQMVSFYVELLGLTVADREDRWAALRDPAGGIGINVQADDDFVRPTWPAAPPAQSMQMHLEIEAVDVPASADWARSLGASEAVPQPADRDVTTLRVMLDPAGHPFCLWS